MKHAISIVLDIEPGLESAVSDTAHHAIQLLNERMDRRLNNWHEQANTLQNFTSEKDRHPSIQSTIDGLRDLARRERASTEIVTAAMSEIRHAMSEADSQWRRKQTATEPSEGV